MNNLKIYFCAFVLILLLLTGCQPAAYNSDNNDKTAPAVNITGIVTTFAGSGAAGLLDGIGNQANFNYPSGITGDGKSLFVSDYYNNIIRKIDLKTSAVTTIAGSLLGASGSSDGTGNNAMFNSPNGIAVDGGNLYVADAQNYTIRKIVIATGEVTTLAGSAGLSGSADGTGDAARFNIPREIAAAGAYLYVTDYSNHTIRRINKNTKEVITFAGTAGSAGSVDGIGSAAGFNFPYGITSDGKNLYVVDRNSHLIRKIIIATAEVTTLAGSAGTSGSQDGMGGNARFYYPLGITTDGINLYLSDTNNHTIRKIQKNTGIVTTLAGSAGNSGFSDGIANTARFNSPVSLIFTGTYLFVTDANNNAIRKIQ